MRGASEGIIKLIGGLQHPNQVRVLLEEMDNGAPESASAARDTLNELPNVSTELLATLQVAILVDEISSNLKVLQAEHIKRGRSGYSVLILKIKKIKKKFFHKIYIYLFIPIIL